MLTQIVLAVFIAFISNRVHNENSCELYGTTKYLGHHHLFVIETETENRFFIEESSAQTSVYHLWYNPGESFQDNLEFIFFISGDNIEIGLSKWTLDEDRHIDERIYDVEVEFCIP